MKRLGQILLEQGWVSPEHLLRALNHQKLVGGRLGTCLLEMEAVEEKLLMRALSQQLGVPAAEVEDLRGVPDEVTALLPAKVARRCQAIPFRLLGGQLSVALLGVRDLAIQDELGFVSGKRLRIHIANEARIFEALEKYYGEECPQRFSQLLDRVNRAKYLWERKPHGEAQKPEAPLGGSPWELPPPRPLPPRIAPPVAATRPNEPAMPARPQDGGGSPAAAARASLATAPASPRNSAAPGGEASPSASIPEQLPARNPADAVEIEVAIPDGGSSAVGPPLPETISVNEVEMRMGRALERDGIGGLVLDFLASRFERAILLSLRKDEVAGWMGRGSSVDEDRLRKLRISLAAPSIFATLRDGAPTFRGPLPPLPAHRQLAEIWGGALPADSILAAIGVRGRPVAMVYADRSPKPVLPADLDELRRLTFAAGNAFELCIRRQKAAAGA